MGGTGGTYRRQERNIQSFEGGLVAARPHGRPRRRWEDNITMDLQEMGEGGMAWIDLAQDRDR